MDVDAIRLADAWEEFRWRKQRKILHLYCSNFVAFDPMPDEAGVLLDDGSERARDSTQTALTRES